MVPPLPNWPLRILLAAGCGQPEGEAPASDLHPPAVSAYFDARSPAAAKVEDLGQAFRSATPPPGRPTAVLETQDGSRWLAGVGFLARHDAQDGWLVVALPGPMSASAVSVMANGPSGRVAIGGANLAVWDPDVGIASPLVKQSIDATSWDAGGALWATSRTGVYRISKGDVETATPSPRGRLPFGAPGTVSGVIEDGLGGLLFVTTRGVSRTDADSARLSFEATGTARGRPVLGLLQRGTRTYGFASTGTPARYGWTDLETRATVCTIEDGRWCTFDAFGQPEGPTWLVADRELWCWPLGASEAARVELPLQRRHLLAFPRPGGGAAVVTDGEVLWLDRAGTIEDRWTSAPLQDTAKLRLAPGVSGRLRHGVTAELEARSGRWNFAPCGRPLACHAGLAARSTYPSAFLLIWPNESWWLQAGLREDAGFGQLNASGYLEGRFSDPSVSGLQEVVLGADGRFWGSVGSRVVAGEQHAGRLSVFAERWLDDGSIVRRLEPSEDWLLVHAGRCGVWRTDLALTQALERLPNSEKPCDEPVSTGKVQLGGGRWRQVPRGWERTDSSSGAVHYFHQAYHVCGPLEFRLRACGGHPLVMNTWDGRAWTGAGWVGVPDLYQGVRDVVVWPEGGRGWLLEGGALLLEPQAHQESALLFPPVSDGRAVATDGEQVCVVGDSLACWRAGGWKRAKLSLEAGEIALAVAISPGGLRVGTSAGALCDEQRCIGISHEPITSLAALGPDRWLAVGGACLFHVGGLNEPVECQELSAASSSVSGDGERVWLVSDGDVYTTTSTSSEWQHLLVEGSAKATQVAALGSDRAAILFGSRLAVLTVPVVQDE